MVMVAIAPLPGRPVTHIDAATLTAYLNHTLAESDLGEVEDHLRSCARCALSLEHWPHPLAEREILIPLGPTGETREFKPPIWSSWIAAVVALAVVLAGGTAAAIWWTPSDPDILPVSQPQLRQEGMPPAPIATDTIADDRSDPVRPDPSGGGRQIAPPPLPPPPPSHPQAAPLPIDSLPVAHNAPATMPPFRRVDRAGATRAMGGQLLELRDLEVQHWEIGPGSSVPGAYPTADVVRQVSQVDDRLILFDQQRLPRGIRLPPELGDTLITTTNEGITVAIWTASTGRRLSVAAVLPRESVLALVRRVR